MRIDELTRNDLFQDVESKVKKRSLVLDKPIYLGVTNNYIVQMQVNSATGSGSYLVKIKLVEYPSLIREEDITTEEKVRLSLAGDMEIHCSCPAFLYWGYDYITTQVSTNVHGTQYMYPSIRNPKLEGVMCKHCYKAFKMFGSYWKRIAKDIDTNNFISEVK